MEGRNYRTLATREPVAVVPAVAAWRRKAQGREWRRKAHATVTLVPVALGGALAMVLGIAVAEPFAIGAGLLLAGFGTLMTVYGFRQARWEREVRIVLRFDRPRVVPKRAHWNGGALASRWTENVARAEALGVTNPELFLTVAGDTECWFPVREGLDVLRALANGCLPGAPEQADLALLVAMLASAPPSEEPLRFRLEYVDVRDTRTGNELFASGYCVALADERGA